MMLRLARIVLAASLLATAVPAVALGAQATANADATFSASTDSTATPPSAPPVEKPKAKVRFYAPKIAVRKDRTLQLRGTATVERIRAADKISIRVYRMESGKWKLRKTIAARWYSRASSSTLRWRSEIKPGMRGRFKVQAVVQASDGRYRSGFSNPTFFRSVSERYVALTFDDGAWYTTDSVRTALEKNNVRATFFMVGQHTRSYVGPAKRVASHGHQIAVHTMTHPSLPSLSNASIKRQLSDCKNLLKKYTGKTARWYRPPGGATNSRVRAVARSVGLREILWTVDTRDWTRVSAATIRSRAVRGARSGGVILMHDGGGNRRQTALAVPGIIRDLRSKGYDFVTMDEWAAIR